MKLIKIKNGNKTYKYTPQIKYTEDLLKPYLEEKQSTENLFKNYNGSDIDDLISYSDTENVTSMVRIFKGCTNLQTIPLLNTGKVTSMYSMFEDCTNLQTIPQLDTDNVENMGSMFRNCTNLQTIPRLNTNNVVSMIDMFRGCNNLQTIPQLNTDNVSHMEGMFAGCFNLKTIDLTSLDKVSAIVYIELFAYSCNSLIKLIIRNMKKMPPLNTNSFSGCYHFKGTVDSTYNPEGLKDGRIYVPDNMVDSLKTATNWSVYADIIVPLSTLEE